MADIRKPAADAPPAEGHSRELQKVNARLRDLVASLRTEKERLSVETRNLASAAAGSSTGSVQGTTAPPPAGAPGAAVDLERKRLSAELALAREALDHANEERERLREKLAEVEKENHRISDEYVAAQEQSSDLAQLYVALERIHGGLTRRETLAALQEVVINVVGSEELAVLERRDDRVILTQAFGIDPGPWRDLPVGRGAIGRAAEGELYVAGRGAPPEPGDEDLSACVPLRAGDRVVGVLAIFRLLGHKPGLEPLDQSMFELLSRHAGVALLLRAAHERLGAG